jgi:hypothetical protein
LPSKKVSAESRSGGGLFKRTAPEPVSFSWKEFDTGEWKCPYCGDKGSITLCSKCNRQVCSARFRVLPDAAPAASAQGTGRAMR